MLLRIMLACDSMKFPEIYKPLYLLAFFSFLCISNMLPHTVTSFDPTRQLAIGGVIFLHQTATIIIKWSKKFQDIFKIDSIPLRYLGPSLLCPIQAISHMLCVFPGQPNDPLFRLPRSGSLVSLTDSVIT